MMLLTGPQNPILIIKDLIFSKKISGQRRSRTRALSSASVDFVGTSEGSMYTSSSILLYMLRPF